jgi:single-strand DNA-binding protein
MNMLNSIILEGKVVGKPTLTVLAPQKVKTVFKLKVFRTARDEEGKEVEIKYTFPVVVYGLLAEKTVTYSEKGDGVRIVGRLVKEKSKILVLAEHIEWKPRPQKNKKVQK